MTSLQMSAQEVLVERFLDSAARGNLSEVSQLLLNAPSLINQTGLSGWTALMLAARNGHHHIVETLLQHGCDKSPVNSSSQTALDISKFWGHRHISHLLGQTEDGCTRVLPNSDLHQIENHFSRETLERMSVKRADQEWLEAKQKEPDTVYLLFSELNPMMSSPPQDSDKAQGETRLCRFRYEAVEDLLRKPETVLIFLGAEKRTKPSSSSTKSSPAEECVKELPVWFAFSTNEEAADLLKLCREKNCSFAKNPNRDLLKLSEEEAGIVSQARSVLAWHSRYSYCPTCGNRTQVKEGGYKRSCLNPDCRSLRGVHNTCYPRVDPVVIMLVVHPDGNQCLLGRKKVFPAGMFSCLAGFVEPGETIESAVCRETEEESGVRVQPGSVHYVSCQPWPMPSSLMIGCLAVAMTTDIGVDRDEIEEARWFTRQQVIDSMLRGSADFTFPPRQTIAHQLIKHWIGINSNL